MRGCAGSPLLMQSAVRPFGKCGALIQGVSTLLRGLVENAAACMPSGERGRLGL